LKSLKERDHMEVIGIDGKIISEWILGKYDVKVWSGLILPRIGISGRLLWLHKRCGIS
jgi:hypothetical protein